MIMLVHTVITEYHWLYVHMNVHIEQWVHLMVEEAPMGRYEI